MTAERCTSFTTHELAHTCSAGKNLDSIKAGFWYPILGATSLQASQPPDTAFVSEHETAAKLAQEAAYLVILKYGSWSIAQGIRQRRSRLLPNMWGKDVGKDGAA